MISCSKEVITPRSSPSATCLSTTRIHTSTKGMPYDQSQLRHLFSLLTQFHESGLSQISVHELRHPVENAPILFGPVIVNSPSVVVIRIQIVTPTVIGCRGNPVIMLLLGHRSCLGLSLGLYMLMIRLMSMVLLVMILLVMCP